MPQFLLKSAYSPTGDQPEAIEKLVGGVNEKKAHQVLLGVTGSGKTFTMANVIAATQKPTLVIAHNKTLAAQLYQEFRDFFPDNAVCYFVSYYDYYQPEAYIPSTDTYIEKESQINDEIDKLRLAATTNLLTREDVIVVASVSCIYNLGSPVEYGSYILEMIAGEMIGREAILTQLSNMQYERSGAELKRGSYIQRGDTILIWPAYQEKAIKLEMLENQIESMLVIDPIGGQVIETLKRFTLYPAKHYVVNPLSQDAAIKQIEADLQARYLELTTAGKPMEAYRLKQKVTYDLENIREFGFTNGIENYSRYFDGREPGDPPYSLLDYFRENCKIFGKESFLTVVDESHMTLPQVRGMYFGDQSRKQTLIDYGFRLPSAKDNRPLKFHEFLEKNEQFVYVSATPNQWEISQAGNEVVEQLVRPTGLLDPTIDLRKTANQIEDLIIEVLKRKVHGQRVLVTTLTKKMAEALTDYLNDPQKIMTLLGRYVARVKNDALLGANNNQAFAIDEIGIGKIGEQFLSEALWTESVEFFERFPDSIPSTKAELPEAVRQALPEVAYLHSDVETLVRSDILDDLRKGTYDVLVGINLLREGLDLPEVSLVAILDADKEGFLRSDTALIQTMGRAARHEQGHVIMYADRMTGSMQRAIGETTRRRRKQIEFNLERGITPQSINKPIREKLMKGSLEDDMGDGTGISSIKANKNSKVIKPNKPMLVNLSKNELIDLNNIDIESLAPHDRVKLAARLRRRMLQAANDLDFELATIIRDLIKDISV